LEEGSVINALQWVVKASSGGVHSRMRTLHFFCLFLLLHQGGILDGHETRKQKAAFVFLSVSRASYIDVYIATDVRAAATVAACLS